MKKNSKIRRTMGMVALLAIVPTTNALAMCNSGGQLGWPVEGSGNTVTSPFGESITRNASVQGRLSHAHAGLDLGAVKNTSIQSACSGTVAYRSQTCNWSDADWREARAGGFATGEGCTVGIKCDNGLYVGFAHLTSTNVSVGSSVSRGQPVAASGNSGKSTDYHLHMQVCGSGYGNAGENPFACKVTGGALDPATVLDSCDSRINDAQAFNDARDQGLACGSSAECVAAYHQAQSCIRSSGGNAERGQSCVAQQAQAGGDRSNIAAQVGSGGGAPQQGWWDRFIGSGRTEGANLGQDIGAIGTSCSTEPYESPACYIKDPCNKACL